MSEMPDSLAPAELSSPAGGSEQTLVGEVRRTIDDRWRLSLPKEFAAEIADENDETIVVKERYGCLSLWKASQWRSRFDAGLAVIEQKIRAERLAQRWGEVQRLGRLVSTRARPVKLAGRSRLVLPDGFRDFLNVPAGGELVVVGALVCVELWNPELWIEQLKGDMPDFNELFQQLSA